MTSLIFCLSGSLFTYLVSSLFYRYWRLRNIPGPFLASLTDLWMWKTQFFGSILPTLCKLHKGYGNIVRTGPNRVSVSSASHVKTIYTSRGEFKKADSYAPMRVFVGGKSVGSIIDMQDEEQNRALKRAVGSAFMLRNVATYEEDVKNTLEALIHRIHEHPHFNLYETLQLFQLDFLIKIAFSENPGHLHSGTDVLGLARLGNKRVSHWFSWQAMPQLERFIFHNSIWSRWFTLPSRWAQMGIQRLKARQHSLKAAQKHTDLLQYAIEASEKYPDVLKPQTVANLVNSIISAGADTTAGTMSTILYLLLKHSDKQQKVFEELENIICQSEVNWPQIPSYKNVNELPYLNAVIKESLRLNPPLAVPLERIVPENGTIIDGIFVPAGTVIGCMGLIVHYDQACYGADVQNFRPERWLEAPKEKLVLMERGFLAWGSGNRICLGRYVAEMEIKIVISTLLLNFQMHLKDNSMVMPFQQGIIEFDSNPINVIFKPKALSEERAMGDGNLASQ